MNKDRLTHEPLLMMAREMTADVILDAADSHEQGRTSELEQRLLKAVGFSASDVAITPFEHHVLLLGYNAGIVGAEQLERVWLPVSDSCRRHDVSVDELAIRKRGLALSATSELAADPQDALMASFTAFANPKLLTRRIVQALLGGVYWPGLSEYELAHVARLSHVVRTWHGYWLSEIGRETCVRHSNFDADEVLAKCGACAKLELQTRSPDTRRARFDGDYAAEIATSAVDTLRYEVHAYWHGLMTGRFAIPAVDPIDHGRACDYARLHHRRNVSAGHGLWVERCLSGERDFGTSPESFAARAAELVGALLAPAVAVDETVHAARRAVRTLQDLGRRVALWAQSDGSVAPQYAQTVEAIGAIITQLRTRDTPDVATSDAAVADALDRVASEHDSWPQILALGYRPTIDPAVEPASSRQARQEAYLQKLERARTPWAPFFRTVLRNAISMAMDGPRQVPLSDELNNAVRAAIHAEILPGEVTALSELLYGLSLQWGPDAGVQSPVATWYNRLSPASLPPPDRWGRFRVRPNPNLGGCPSSVKVDWLQSVIDGQEDENSTPPLLDQAALSHVLIGEGRYGPIMLPYTRARSQLLEALQYSPTLQELADQGFSTPALARALDEELVVLIHSSTSSDLAGFPAIAPALVDLMTPGISDEGPWADREQATYYEALCDRGEHYAAVARALVARVRIRVGDQVADLGCGTGLVTREVLKRLGPEGEVVGVDPAPPMIEAARRRFEDSRVKFKRGNAHSLNDAMPLGPGFSSVICSSAIWLERSPLLALRAIRRCLRRRGQLAFSIPAEYLGEVEHMTDAAAVEVAQALVEARQSLNLRTADAPVSPGLPKLLSTRERLQKGLERAGFSDLSVEVFENPWTVADYLDWMGQPVIIGNMFPGTEKEQRQAFLDRVAATVDTGKMLRARWLLVTGRRG